MAKTREIKKRIKAVGNIGRITKTMQMIATSKFARAQAAATATKPYTEGLFGLVTELAATAGDIDHPLISGPAGGFAPGARDLTLVITSDRGLCGPYNSSTLRLLTAHLKAQPGGARAALLEVVGKKGAGFLKYNQLPIGEQHSFGDKPGFDKVGALAQTYMDRFNKGEITGVKIVSMRFISAGKQQPEVTQLLPLKPPAKSAKAGGPAGNAAGAGLGAGASTGLMYEFSPQARELLADLLPATVKATLFQVFNDAIVSEHVARMVAMKSATDAAKKAKKLLTRQFNRARQAQITTELTEIIGGAAALG
jgi:F-type H+-transporting ATPase subunit gamma